MASLPVDTKVRATTVGGGLGTIAAAILADRCGIVLSPMEVGAMVTLASFVLGWFAPRVEDKPNLQALIEIVRRELSKDK